MEVVEHAMEMQIEDNNQFAEALFGMIKHNQNVHEHCSEPAEYVVHRSEDIVKSNRVFVDQVQMLEQNIGAVEKRKVAKARRKSVVLTQDALMQQEEEEADEVWQREGSAAESESSLRGELKAFFQEKELTAMKPCHEVLKGHFADHINMKLMSYSTFLAFMRGNRSIPLKKNHKQQLKMLLANHAETQRASL
jgi:hypothetical protein